MANNTYRAIIVFDAASPKVAKERATAAAKAALGKLDRLTERRETWGPISDENGEEAE